MDALVPDDLWAVVEPLLPPEPEKPKGGRPRASNRAALAGIILVLRSGMQWKHLRRSEVGCNGKTSWQRLGTWQAAGVWAALHRVMLEQLQDADALDWSRAALDSASLPAKRMARPVRKWLGSGGLCSLHKRIRPSGSAVGQDGDPRVLGLIKGSASSAIFAERLSEHQSTVRPSSSHRPQT